MRRETVACTRPRSHPQEAAGRSLPARLEDGSTRLLPTFGPRQPPPFVQAVRMGREEEQNLVGRRNRGLREDSGACRASNERRRRKSLLSCLRSRVRPVLPWLQPEAIPCERFQPRTHSSTVQGRFRKDSDNRSGRPVEQNANPPKQTTPRKTITRC